MSDPIRLRDDPSTAAELRSLLGRAPRTRPLDPAARLRMGHRLNRFLSLPLVLTLGLTMKSAAASIAIATGSIAIGAVVVHEVRLVRSLAVPLSNTVKSSPQHDRSAPIRAVGDASRPPSVENEPAQSTAAVAAFPDDESAEGTATVTTNGSLRTAPRAAARSPIVEPSAHVGATKTEGLEQEAAMLETARRALGTSPGEALAIVEEHRARFPRANLSLERELIRLDALYRLGRHAEARRSAESLRQRGGLYAQRVERFIEKLDHDQK